MEVFEPKWVNSILNDIGAKSLRIESLNIISINICIIYFYRKYINKYNKKWKNTKNKIM